MGLGKVRYAGHFIWVVPDPCLIDDVAQEADLSLLELALFFVQFEARSPDDLQCLGQALVVYFLRFAMN